MAETASRNKKPGNDGFIAPLLLHAPYFHCSSTDNAQTQAMTWVKHSAQCAECVLELAENSGTLFDMRCHLAQLSRLLRVSFMALLLLGLIVKPVMAQLSDLHAAEHAAGAIAEHGHAHGPGNVDPAGDGHEPSQDHEDHATGAHGFMHQSGGFTTLTGLVSMLAVPTAFGRLPDLPLPPCARMPRRDFSTPFRPPIV